MRWFQVDSDTPNDPRVRAVVRALGNEGLGGLFRLWCHVANHGAKKAGHSLTSAGKAMSREELIDASGLSADQFDTLVSICVENGHFSAREWTTKQVIAIPAMARRADTYTKRRVRTRVAHTSKKVPLQDSTNQDIPSTEERGGLTPPPAPPTGDPADNLRVITRLARILRRKHPSAEFSDLKDLTKAACAERRIAYDPEVVGKAVDSALSRRLTHAH